MAFKDILKGSGAYLTQKAKEALEWYKKRIGNLSKPSGQASNVPPPTPPPTTNFRRTAQPEIGKMYMYAYDPRWKEVLPFWDMFPLTIVIDFIQLKEGAGFLGLNLHYLPTLQRIALLTALSDILTDDRYDENTRFNISYGILKEAANKYSGYEECVKKYYFGHVRSAFTEVVSSDWERVAMLPLQRWQTNPNRKYSSKARPPY